MQQFIRTIDALDRRLFLTIHHRLWPSERLRSCTRSFIGLVTHLGSLPFHSLLILILLALSTTRRLGWKLFLVQIIVCGVVQLIKFFTARARPYDAICGVVPLRTEKDSSFPSGHSASAFAAATVIGWLHLPVQLILLALAVLIGYSRVYIGVHYPTDVMAGSGIGLIISLLVLVGVAF